MDSITQAVLGGAIGEAGFGKKLGGRGVFFGAVCGTLPDLDVVAGLAGEWASLVHHRGISHSLFFAPVIAPLVGYLGWRMFGRRAKPSDWMLLAFLALVTHPLLDVCTAYGTQLLVPLSRDRFAIDAISIVDPIYTVPLLVAVVLAALRRVPTSFSVRFAQAALLFTTLYLGFGFVQSQRALARGTAQLEAQGFAPADARALPTFLNVWAFRIVARDEEGAIRVGHLSLFRPRPISFEAFELPPSPLLGRALESEEGRIFTWFADDYVVATVEAQEQGAKVRLSDARYAGVGSAARFMWGADFFFDEAGALVRAARWQRERSIEPGRELDALWTLILEGATAAEPAPAPPRTP